MHGRLLSPLCGLLLLAATTRPAAAAAGGDSTHTRGMQDTVTVLKPVTVQGDRTVSPERASSTTVRLDRSRLVRFAPATVGDAVLAIPGVDMSKTGPWASHVSMRGLSGERVLVLVDGVRLQTGRGHGAQTSLVPIDRIEAVEAQPGCGSAVNGSDALAGTIELSTHRALFAERGRATLTLNARGADPGAEHAEFARLRWMTRNLGFEVSGNTNRLGELVVPDSTYAHSGYRDQDVTGRLAWRAGSATFDYEHSAHAGHAIQLPAFQSRNGSTASFPLQGRDADRIEFTLPWAAGRHAARVLAVQQHFRTHYDEAVIAPRFVRGRQVGTSRMDTRSRVSMWSKSVQPSLGLGPVRFFGEWRRESTAGPVYGDSTNRNMADEVVYQESRLSESVPPARRDVWGAGLSGGHALLGTRFDGGLRWDRMLSQSDSTGLGMYPDPATRIVDERLSGEAGVSRAIGWLTPYAHVASNFRAPNLEERFVKGIIHGTIMIFGAPHLRPEVGRNTEVGLRLGELAGGHLGAARVSAYRTEVTDLISMRYATLVNGIARFEYRNVRRARLTGVEAQADVRFGGVQAAFAAAFPQGIDLDTHEPVSDLGAARATCDLRVPAPRFVPQGTLAVRVRWTDASRTSSGEEILARAAFWMASAEAGCTALDARWTLAVRNLTNTRYCEPLSFIPEPGRAISLSVRRDVSLPWLAIKDR